MKLSENTKYRHWVFVAYPESLPKNWIEIIQETGLQFAISPLHEFDINPDGEEKKPHYHVILSYPGPTTFKNVKQFVVDELGQPIPQRCLSLKGAYRYFTHKDNPEKYQYNANDIQIFNGFDIEDFEALTKTQIRMIKIDLVNLVKDKKFKFFDELIDYLVINELFDMVEVAFQFTYMLNTYIKSKNDRLSIKNCQ